MGDSTAEEGEAGEQEGEGRCVCVCVCVCRELREGMKAGLQGPGELSKDF